MTIRITKQSTGHYFAFVEDSPDAHGAGSTPQKAVERLMAAAPELFGERSASEGEIQAALRFNKEWGV